MTEGKPAAGTPARADEYAGREVAIVGLAREGTALARYLVSVGAVVTISDSRGPADLAMSLRQVADLPVRLSLGGNRLEDLTGISTLFLSPGVPLSLPFVQAARLAGIPIRSEPLLFLERCRAPVIGVTGSSGKTTTTSLIGSMLAAAGRRTWVGGNIGRPLIGEVNDIKPGDAVVMELSSFQLALFDRSPHVAVVTNLSPDHLDRHESLADYYDAKKNLVRFQTRADIAVLNADDVECRRLAEGIKSEVCWTSLEKPVSSGAFLRDRSLWLSGTAIPGRSASKSVPFINVADLRLPGRHNIANVLAAATAASALGASLEAISSAAASFGGVPHRLERIPSEGDVCFYNDSIATSPERAIAALETFDQPVRWLVGGRSKQLPLGRLPEIAARRVAAAYCYGESGAEIATALDAAGVSVYLNHDLESAFRSAVKDAHPDDVVLLAPACTSFDQFADYAARGEAFRQLVARIAGEASR